MSGGFWMENYRDHKDHREKEKCEIKKKETGPPSNRSEKKMKIKLYISP